MFVSMIARMSLRGFAADYSELMIVKGTEGGRAAELVALQV